MNVRGSGKRGRPKNPKDETKKLTMVTMLATGCVGLFTSIALLTKHDHWQLHQQEAQALAEALKGAIDTLPVKYYESITAIVEKWIPWIHLAFVGGTIIITRIEESAERVKEKDYQAPVGSPERSAPRSKETGPFDDFTSLGWTGQ